MMAHATTRAAGPYRAGICSLVGLPNVGKSTLLNRLVGQRLSIVTHKAQTTRQRLLGIYSDESHQAVFVDTPGLLTPRYALHEAMQAEAARATAGADVLVYVADAGWEESIAHAIESRLPPGPAALLCLNKVDRVSPDETDATRARLESAGRWRSVVPTIATTEQGVAKLKQAILDLLPEGPPLYPVDEVATAPLRFFVAELIRETCFEVLEKEVPYSSAVLIDEFRESTDPIYISGEIHVERESQKGIVIGRGGSRIREIGRRSRLKIEDLVGRSVFLDLRVKVSPNWRRRPGRLKVFGYDVPDSR